MLAEIDRRNRAIYSPNSTANFHRVQKAKTEAETGLR